jgi:hypothetical protein
MSSKMLDMLLGHPYDVNIEINFMTNKTPAYNSTFSFWRFFFIFSSVHPEV